MQLPNNSIGISDLLSYRDCPRRFSYGMRRHVGKGEQSDDATPEAGMKATWYGSAIHEAIALTEDGMSDEQAISTTWKRYGRYLDPEDLALLGEDLALYHTRDFPNTRTVGSEEEYNVPLFKDENDEWVYFRCKIDRIYERLDAPGTFIMVDYKSSKWPKSQEEVDADLQMWAYNFAIHEVFPECERLLQVYDQLRYGQLPTKKTDAEREKMRKWLIESAKAVIADESTRDDGLMIPSKNRWCPWCPIIESCPVIDQLTEYGKVEIAALAPVIKEGRKTKLDLDPGLVEDYAATLKDVTQAIRILEKFAESVKGLMKEMAPEDRLALGWDVRERKNTVWSPRALQELHKRMGDDFWSIAKITKTSLESALSEDPEALQAALDLGDQVAGALTLIEAK